jgi:hypothetical protein
LRSIDPAITTIRRQKSPTTLSDFRWCFGASDARNILAISTDATR